MIVTSVKAAYAEDGQAQVNFDRLVDDIFSRLFKDKTFDKCNISVGELRTMQQVFKEEKLYYDFLH